MKTSISFLFTALAAILLLGSACSKSEENVQATKAEPKVTMGIVIPVWSENFEVLLQISPNQEPTKSKVVAMLLKDEGFSVSILYLKKNNLLIQARIKDINLDGTIEEGSFVTNGKGSDEWDFRQLRFAKPSLPYASSNNWKVSKEGIPIDLDKDESEQWYERAQFLYEQIYPIIKVHANP